MALVNATGVSPAEVTMDSTRVWITVRTGPDPASPRRSPGDAHGTVTIVLSAVEAQALAETLAERLALQGTEGVES